MGPPEGRHLNSVMRMRASRPRAAAALRASFSACAITEADPTANHPAAFLGRFSPLLEAEYIGDVADAGLRALAT
jgi:hypothetical protein